MMYRGYANFVKIMSPLLAAQVGGHKKKLEKIKPKNELFVYEQKPSFLLKKNKKTSSLNNFFFSLLRTFCREHLI